MLRSIKEKANDVLIKYEMNSPEKLNLRYILYGEGFLYDEEDLYSHDGRMTKDLEKGSGIITINKNIQEAGQKRFVIAHELGHHFLSNENYKNCSGTDVKCIYAKEYDEKDANEFSACLLMPEHWVRRDIGWTGDAVSVLREMSKKYSVTLSAAGIRYAEIGDKPITVIATKGNKIIWVKSNKKMSYRFVEVGSTVHPDSGVSMGLQGLPVHAQKRRINPGIWFQNDFNYQNSRTQYEGGAIFFDGEKWIQYGNEKKDEEFYFIEQTFQMRKYDMYLTMIWEEKER